MKKTVIYFLLCIVAVVGMHLLVNISPHAYDWTIIKPIFWVPVDCILLGAILALNLVLINDDQADEWIVYLPWVLVIIDAIWIFGFFHA